MRDEFCCKKSACHGHVNGARANGGAGDGVMRSVGMLPVELALSLSLFHSKWLSTMSLSTC